MFQLLLCICPHPLKPSQLIVLLPTLHHPQIAEQFLPLSICASLHQTLFHQELQLVHVFMHTFNVSWDFRCDFLDFVVQDFNDFLNCESSILEESLEGFAFFLVEIDDRLHNDFLTNQTVLVFVSELVEEALALLLFFIHPNFYFPVGRFGRNFPLFRPLIAELRVFV